MSLKLINLFIELCVQKMWKLWDRKHYKDVKEILNYMAIKKDFPIPNRSNIVFFCVKMALCF